MRLGPVIRITPDELHVNDVGFLDTVYAPSMHRRDKYQYPLSALRVPGGVGTTASYDVHRKRREALSPFFSRRNVLHLEPLIVSKIEQLCGLIAKHADDKTPVNLSDVLFAFSNEYVLLSNQFDTSSVEVERANMANCSVTTNFLFAEQGDVLADEAKAATLRHNSNELLLGIHINRMLPWVIDFLDALPLSISKPMMPPGLLDLQDLFAVSLY
jgi:hypothetical protein